MCWWIDCERKVAIGQLPKGGHLEKGKGCDCPVWVSLIVVKELFCVSNNNHTTIQSVK